MSVARRPTPRLMTGEITSILAIAQEPPVTSAGAAGAALTRINANSRVASYERQAKRPFALRQNARARAEGKIRPFSSLEFPVQVATR